MAHRQTITAPKEPPVLLSDEQVSVQTEFSPVSVPEVKEYLVISHGDDDALLNRLIQTATTLFQEHTNHYLKEQTRQIAFDRFSSRYRIPAQPVSSLDAAETVNEGSATSLAISDWYLMDVSPAEIRFADGGSFPEGDWQMIRFEYTAGYATHSDVTQKVKGTLKKMVSDLYEWRSTKGEGIERSPDDLPLTWQDMLAGHKTPYYSQPSKSGRGSFFL